eukprot:108987-Chlamydomonas_euryale.AAC.1
MNAMRWLAGASRARRPPAPLYMAAAWHFPPWRVWGAGRPSPAPQHRFGRAADGGAAPSCGAAPRGLEPL